MPAPANHTDIEKKLWASADGLRANSKLKASEYSVPVLGLIFLRFADHRFTQIDNELKRTAQVVGSRRTVSKIDYQARGVMYLPDSARFSNLLKLPESENIGKAINDAMRAIEMENDDLRDVLPKSYNHLDNDTLVALLKTFQVGVYKLDSRYFSLYLWRLLLKFLNVPVGQRRPGLVGALEKLQQRLLR